MSKGVQIVSFFLEQRFYGLDIRIVKEIHPSVSISTVPRTPDHIRGLVNIRGQVVLVMDVAVIFGRRPRPVTEDSQIIILKTAPEIRNVRGMDTSRNWSPFGDKPIGLLVDRIGDAVQVPEQGIEPTPQHIDETKARFFCGVARQGEDLLMLLDAGELISFKETDSDVQPSAEQTTRERDVNIGKIN